MSTFSSPAGHAGRTADGTWAKRVSGNPAGRPKGARNKATLIAEALEAGEPEEFVRELAAKAHAGDSVALRFLLARLFPVPRGRTVELDLPAGAETDPAAIFAATIRAM